MSSARDRYRTFCESEFSIPLFSQAWWLDALAGVDHWDVALVEKGGQIVASMPYVIRKRFGKRFIGQPVLTQSLGPWLRDLPGKTASRLSREKDLLQALINELPQYDRFSQSWHFSQTNWLPFFWAGFKQTTFYTYRLSDLSDEKALWNGLKENIRTDIRKAESRFSLRVRTDLDLDTFWALNLKTFNRQSKKPPYSKELLTRLDSACLERSSRLILIAEDEEGRAHAGVYLVWDKQSAYYLMGGGDPDLRNSGATSLCMWKAIQFAKSVTKSFDFEGSMIEPVERFVRAYGAEQTQYFSVSHTPSNFLKVLLLARNLLS